MCVELEFIGFKMYISPCVKVLVPYVYIRRMVKGQDSFIMYFYCVKAIYVKYSVAFPRGKFAPL